MMQNLIKLLLRCHLIWVACLLDFQSQTLSAETPNIIVLLADDLGFGDVGCYNRESRVPTPNIDRLALSGMRFTDAHSPSTVCTPTRFSILTGSMCFRTGFRSVFTGVDGPLISQSTITLPEILQDAGYHTACFGKWHIGMTFHDSDGLPVPPRGGGLQKVRQVDFTRPVSDGPLHHGFDHFFGTVCCPTTDFLYAYINGNRVTEIPDQFTPTPEGTWLDYHFHRPGLTSPDFKFDQVDLVFLEQTREFLTNHRHQSGDRPFFLYHCFQSAHLPAIPAPEFVGSTSAGPLGDFIHQLDFMVGEIVESLRKNQLLDNTLIIFTSDNGPEIIADKVLRDFDHDSAHPWRGLKRDNWEGGHRVPFIASWPGVIPPGTSSSHPLCLTDIYATCAGFAGADIPTGQGPDSFDLSAVFRSPDHPVIRDHLLHQTINNSLAIRVGPWKLLDHAGSGGNNYNNPSLAHRLPENFDLTSPVQLYNLDQDPHEDTNLASRYPELVRSLKSRLDYYRASGQSIHLE